MTTLYIVATPIGNLKDITLRAIETLQSVDMVLAEDTRVARKLLSHLGIQKDIVAYHEHTTPRQMERVIETVTSQNVALITDAGTPAISDPGQRLVAALRDSDVRIVPIPGPSALAAIISVSDIDTSEFLFLGFPPHKKGRQTFFKRVAISEVPVVLFESPHRIEKTLHELLSAAGDRALTVGRELTKIHEEVFRGSISDAQAHFVGEKVRGEFVLIIGKIGPKDHSSQ
jgi:16S rRNA (cytidine1402-2'-O)-methyltransferase